MANLGSLGPEPSRLNLSNVILAENWPTQKLSLAPAAGVLCLRLRADNLGYAGLLWTSGAGNHQATEGIGSSAEKIRSGIIYDPEDT